MPGETILLEQVVYGSFAFSDRGYAVLARSPGVREEWLSALLASCRRFGEAPHGVAPAPAIFSLRLGKGPRAVVGAFPQGCDDRGRPGAMAFHALLIADRDFRRSGGDPFAFVGCLRGEWTAETSTLPTLPCRPESTIPLDALTDDDPRIRQVVAALVRGRRVALESDAPIDALARGVWARLPESARGRASVATWAFGNENRFDLVALPRLAGVPLDASYLLPGTIDEARPDVAGPGPTPSASRALTWSLELVVAAAVILAILAVARPPGRDATPPDPPAGTSTLPDDPRPALDPDRRGRALAALVALAERFDVPDPGDPAELMARFADQVRYRGPLLSPAELARLAEESDPDRVRALAWDGRIRLFADDRPLPESFPRVALEQQLALFAWSYHLPEGDDPGAIPAAVANALSREGPIVPTPLAAKYPTLSDYARFLMRLPRRNEDGPP